MKILNLFASTVFATTLSLPVAFDSMAFAPEHQGGQTAVGEPQLRSFARAYLEVEKIRESYGSQISDNKDPEKHQAIEQEAVTKIHDVITKEGLSPQTYTDIVHAANANDELRMTLVQLIEEERAAPK